MLPSWWGDFQGTRFSSARLYGAFKSAQVVMASRWVVGRALFGGAREAQFLLTVRLLKSSWWIWTWLGKVKILRSGKNQCNEIGSVGGLGGVGFAESCQSWHELMVLKGSASNKSIKAEPDQWQRRAVALCLCGVQLAMGQVRGCS